MSGINLSNVNITIQKFQEISSGKYNAGEVRLDGSHSLEKINHHVDRTGKNIVSLSQAEVIAIKDAFVRALSANGVQGDEIARIREELGLAPKGESDVSLSRRSIKPLSRQQIREILDKNAQTINRSTGTTTIRTYDQLHARYSDAERAEIVNTRNATNADLIRKRATLPDRAISDLQSVLSGEVHFRNQDERTRLIATAEQVKAKILQRSPGGVLSSEPGATIQVHRGSDGLNVTFALGGSDADAVRRLDDMLILLRSCRQPNRKTLDVRREFASLPNLETRAAWVGNLANDPQGGFKARTVAIGLMFDRGIRDHATLSLVNRISDFAAIALVSALVNHADGLRGDALRQSPIVATLEQQVEPGPMPNEGQAFVPVRSAKEYIDAVYDGASGKDALLLTHEMKAISEEVLAELKTKFGDGVVTAKTKFSSFVTNEVFTSAFGDTTNGVHGRTPAEMKAAIVAGASREAARAAFSNAIKPMLRAAGVKEYEATGVASALIARHPDLGAKLADSKSLAEVGAVVEEFRPQIEAGVRRKASMDKFRAASADWYRAALAQALKVPVSSLAGKAVNMNRLTAINGNLVHDIGEGVNPADTEAEIEQAFRAVVDKHVAERVAVLNQLGGLQVHAEAIDNMKFTILMADKLKGIDLRQLKTIADAIPVENLVAALDIGDKDGVLREMKAVARRTTDDTMKAIGAQQGMLEEVNTAGQLVLAMALAKTPGSFDMIRTFLLRPDVADMSPQSMGDAAGFVFYRLDEPIAKSNAALADMLGKAGLAPLSAQAVSLGLDDLGLDGLSVEEKMKFVSGGELRALAKDVRESTVAVTPSRLREFVHRQFAKKAETHVVNRYLSDLATKNGIDPEGIAGFCRNVLFRRDGALRRNVETAILNAAATGADPHAAVAEILAPANDVALAALRAFDEIKRVDATAMDVATREIAERANLPVEDVRKNLNVAGVAVAGGSLAVLRDTIRDELGKPDFDVSKWDPASAGDRARAKLQSFIDKKVAFLENVLSLNGVDAENPLSDAVRGKLVVATLATRVYSDPEVPAAANRILQRQETRAAFQFAKASLVPEKVAQMSDSDVFRVFEAIALNVKNAIVADLTEEKYGLMESTDKDVLHAIINAALVDYCGETLLSAAERLAADGRLDKVEAAGREISEGYSQDYMNAASGVSAVGGQRIPVDEAAALRATQSRTVAYLGHFMFGAVREALEDEWLPADLAGRIHAAGAGEENIERAATILKRAPELLNTYAAGLNAEQRAELKALLITLDLSDAALDASKAALGAKANELKFSGAGAFDAPGSVSGKIAIDMGYALDELPMLEGVATIYRQATGCTEAEARAAAIDHSSPARRLYAYGGRFTASVENYRAGLALLGTFKNWFAATNAAIDSKRGKNPHVPEGATPTVLNADTSYFTTDAAYAYEKFIFEHLAIDDALPLAADDPEKIFGMENNPVTRFVGRAYVTSSVNTFAQIPPEKRVALFAVFDLLAPLPKTEAELGVNYHGQLNVEFTARVLAHLDEIDEMRKNGTLTKESFCNRFLTDIPGAAGMTMREMGRVVVSRMSGPEILVQQLKGNGDAMMQVSLMMQSSGSTIEEAVAAVLANRKLPSAPYVAEANGGISELNGTAKGGRAQMVMDFERPYNPVYVANDKTVLEKADNVFAVVFPDGTRLQSASEADAAKVADKVAAFCGDVHPAQLNSLYMALTQAAEGPIVGAFNASHGIKTTEHMPLTYTLSRDAQTGVVTVRYSEPAGFPVKFHWEATIKLDGAVESTPIAIESDISMSRV